VSALPATAAWRHHEARDGFEVVFLREDRDGFVIAGHTAAVEDDVAWAVSYRIWLDDNWVTRRALVSGQTAGDSHETVLDNDGHGTWLVDGVHADDLDGCFDVDLESSALTNAFPVRRLRLAVGSSADAPAAYVRATDLAVERLEQSYVRIEDAGGNEAHQRYDYTSPAFDFRCILVYDPTGLVLEYPGIAQRIK
jgi:hypothetical protein